MPSAAVLAGGQARRYGRHGTVDRLLANVNTPAECDEIETLLGHSL